MKIGIETARQWLYDTAEKFLAGEDVDGGRGDREGLASEANLDSAAAAVQIFGGSGYMTEHGIEKDLRDAIGRHDLLGHHRRSSATRSPGCSA